MLATSKMTGLDLGGGPGMSMMKEDSSKRSSTSSEEMLSTPKLMPDSAHNFNKTSPSVQGTASQSEASNNNNNESDMLDTPNVVTTPKTSDIWLTHTSMPHGLKFDSSNLAPREPPKDLPMDSDIGLRSPSDGILAKRREKFRKKQQSSLSDSNSCDTPTSENNSPRDLSVKGNSKPSTPTLVKHSPTPPPLSASSISPSFKHPHRPEALRLKDVAELPAHYTPSPLTVPSPNWMVVKHILEGSGSVLKTPKELDSSVFDFLTPATPRSRLFREGGLDSERFARMSPRHSPRLTIPEVATDLSPSNRMPTDLSKSMPQKMEEEAEAAEDLRVPRSSNSRLSTDSTPPPLQVSLHQPPHIKQELTPRSPSPLHQMPTAPELIKIERSMPPQPNHFDLGQRLPPPASSSPYVPYTSAIPMSHAGVFRRYISTEPSNYRDHHNSSPIYQPQMPGQPEAAWPGQWVPEVKDEEASVSPPHAHFNSPVKPISVKTTDSLMVSEFKKAKLDNSAESAGAPSKKSFGGKSTPGGTAGGKTKLAAAGAKENGSKRVYSCPHCQRSYDWNYNLNRHLKYECGKENAFQCSKCGRKFPHKQNCVYHLKRKHKIVCDTIDQYMTNGLVIFRGTQNPGGQHLANPQ